MEAWQVARVMIFCQFLLITCACARPQEKIITSSTDAAAVHSSDENESDWSYGCVEDGCGPSHWAELSPDWDLCKNGQQQSPINIATFEVVPDPALLPYDPVCLNTPTTIDANFTNDGHNFKMLRRGVTVLIENINYTLAYLTFKAPSEHTIDGVQSAFEAQILWKSESGAYAGHAWLYNYNPDGSDNPYLMRYLQHLPALHKSGDILVDIPTPFELPEVDIFPYYRYVGSLTSPPCTEGVLWTVDKRVYTVSEKQQKDLVAALHGVSNRPIQPSNGRIVYGSVY
nr:carbonic anhydrase-like 2a [Phlegmariurus tetrastichus]